MEEARERIGHRDPGDVPFLAPALAVPCDGIWTQNAAHFAAGGVPVWGTREVLAWVQAADPGP